MFLAIGLGIGIGKIPLVENWYWNYYWKNHFQYYWYWNCYCKNHFQHYWYWSQNFGIDLLCYRGHSVSLFTSQECPRIHLDRNPRQNCPIGQPSTKKWFFSPDQFGPWPECKGKSGEIRSLLETLGSTLYPRKKLYLPKSYMDYNFC